MTVEARTRNNDEPIIGPMIGMMMAVMMLSIIPGIVGAGPKPPDEYANLEITVYDSGVHPPTPLGGVTVSLTGSGISLQALTGANGKVNFAEVPLGHYSVSASKHGYVSGSISVSLSTAGSYSDNIFLIPETTDPQQATLSGTVRSSQSTNPPINEAFVELRSGGTTIKSTHTAPDGTYSIGDIDPGWYTIRVNKVGYDIWDTYRELTEGSNTQNAYLNPEHEPSADFDVINLDVSPSTVNVGQQVNIGATIKNIGDTAGVCTVSTDPGDDPTFVLGITPGTWSPALVPAVYVPTIDIQPVISLMIVVMMMGMMTKMVK